MARPLARLVGSLLLCAAGSTFAASAHAQEDTSLGPLPVRPFRGGLLVEGGGGVYVPLGELARLSSPTAYERIAVGWDFTSWIAAYALVDATYLQTDRAPPPPNPKGFVYWGFGGGVRLALPLGDRWRIPLRLEVSAHEGNDQGVLKTYGFPDADKLSLSYGGALGIEWRAKSRHYGVLLEVGVRRDAGLDGARSSGGTLAILPSLGLHYTL